MSWQATAWADALPYNVVGHAATRVLFKLANVAAPDGSRAWRSKSEMADELGVSSRTVQRALQELQDADLIRLGNQAHVAHLRDGYRPTVYNMNMGWTRMYSQPELPEYGHTETPDHEGRQSYPQFESGETTGDRHRNDIPTRDLKDTHLPKRAHEAHDVDRCRSRRAKSGTHHWDTNGVNGQRPCVNAGCLTREDGLSLNPISGDYERQTA